MGAGCYRRSALSSKHFLRHPRERLPLRKPWLSGDPAESLNRRTALTTTVIFTSVSNMAKSQIKYATVLLDFLEASMSKKAPKVYTQRSPVGYFFDAVMFPFRAVFIHERSRGGLSSLRDQRMRAVAKYCSGRTLDIGCGPNNLFIRHYYRAPDSVGIDCFPYEGVANVVEAMPTIPRPDA